MRIRRFSAGVLACGVLALVGACAAPDGTGDPPGGSPDGTPGGTGSPPATAPPTLAPPTLSPPVPPPSDRAVVTITGEVVEGVEMNCFVLRQAGGPDYLLIVDPAELPVGATVTVRGYPEPDLVTYCQQGTPFVVTEVVDGDR
jgi:hypothetical protein